MTHSGSAPLGDAKLVAQEPWPAEGIEWLGACPVCGIGESDILFHGLRDRIFNYAPGAWDMHKCLGCGSGYLDPRPTADSIHLAYRTYHTHIEPDRVPTEKLRGVRRLQRVLANGYKNWKYGTDLQPSHPFGVLVAYMMPFRRAMLDRDYRHLPMRKDGGRVLDVGFGNGGYLQNALEMGWRAVGTDFDPEVVENARRRGFDARLGTVDAVEGPFDVITLSHVIEHFHDPVAELQACHRLLAPGGMIWLETPNVEAIGLARFGRDWRGLEPPRHLVLFSRASLANILRDAGFVEISDLKQASPVSFMYVLSNRVRSRLDPYGVASVSMRLQLEIAATRIFEWMFKSRREFVAMTARKAG